jgi:hypothetical protein
MLTQRLSTWLALRCKELQFQRFLRVPSEDLAAHSVRAICQVASRGDIDSNPDAQKRFHQFIRLPYQQFLQDPQNQTTQEK